MLLLIMKKSVKLRTFLMLGVIKVKYNIRLSRLARIKTRNGMMFLILIIVQKLLKIFIPIIPINHDLKQEVKSKKKIDLFKKSHI